MEVEATTCPLAFVERTALPRFEKYREPTVASEVDDWLMLMRLEKVVEALKILFPLKVLLLARRVDDAAVIVYVPFSATVVPLIVARLPERRLVPIVDVAITLPLLSTARIELERPVNHAVVSVVSVVEAFAKELRPVQVLLLERRVEEAAVTVTEPPAVSVWPLMVPRFPVR